MHLSKPIRLVAWMALVTLTASVFSRAQDAAAPTAPAPPPAPPANPFFFHDGDTPVVFLGGGITEQQMYTTLIETYTLTRFPAWKITFRNAGWEGDTAGMSKRGGIDTALPRDVLALQPKMVTINFGMYDAHGGDPAFDAYLESTTKLVKDLEKAGARVALIASSPEESYDAGPAGSNYNVMLKKYVDGMTIVSDNEKVPFVDEYTPLVKFIEAGRQAGVLSSEAALGDPNVVRLTKDGIHPNWGGHLIMAAIILQEFRAPAEVSSVSVDAEARSITSTLGCTVEWQNVSNGAIQFKRADTALPWPLPDDPMIDVALKIPGFDPATALNRYELKVTGLKETSYKLTIDGQDIGAYASADLANGINLGFVRQGPIYEQGQELLRAVQDKNDAYFNRWRNVQLFETPDWLKKDTGVEAARAAEIKRLDQVIADDEDSIEVFRKPVPHLFKLTPVVVAK